MVSRYLESNLLPPMPQSLILTHVVASAAVPVVIILTAPLG